MKNLFREILIEMAKGKLEIIPHNPKDIEIAKQMEDLVNWKASEGRTDNTELKH